MEDQKNPEAFTSGSSSFMQSVIRLKVYLAWAA